MRVYTLHGSAAAPEGVVLVREGFAWPALFTGPLWLLWHRAFREAGLWLVLFCLLWAVSAVTGIKALGAGFGLSLWWAVGLFGQDCRRRALARRGLALAGVVAARSREEALLRWAGSAVRP